MHASIGRMTGTAILLIWESLLLNCQKSGVKPAYRHVGMVISRQELASVNSQDVQRVIRSYQRNPRKFCRNDHRNADQWIGTEDRLLY
jgi:hypothetical protein